MNKIAQNAMSQSDKANDGVTCDKCGGEYKNERGLKVHQRSCTGGADTPTDNGQIPDTLPTERDWYESNTDTLQVIQGTKGDDKNHTMTDKVAKQVIGRFTSKYDMNTKDAYIALFGKCDKCDNGAYGFDHSGCKQHMTDTDETDDSTGEDTITVTIDGKEVSGDEETVKALLNQ